MIEEFPDLTKENIVKKTTTATGISKSTLYNILSEQKKYGVLKSPSKRKYNKRKTNIDEKDSPSPSAFTYEITCFEYEPKRECESPS